MADLVVTAADVESATGRPEEGTSGEAGFAVGKSVYKSLSDNLWYLAQNDVSAAASGAGSKVGIVLSCGPGANQPCKVHVEGDIDVGATLTVGETYYIGAGAGGICAVADIANPKYVTALGVATAADNLRMKPCISGVQRAA